MVEQLKEAIRQSGQSLNQLARESGVGSDRLSRFMTGKRDLTLEAAEKVCRVLHIGLGAEDSPDQIMPAAGQPATGAAGKSSPPKAKPADQPPAGQADPPAPGPKKKGK